MGGSESAPVTDTFELRICLYRTTGVKPPDGVEFSNHFVSIALETDEFGNPESPWIGKGQSSTTFFRCRDGNGVFNWRYVFSGVRPNKKPVARFKIWNDGIDRDQVLGECTIDLREAVACLPGAAAMREARRDAGMPPQVGAGRIDVSRRWLDWLSFEYLWFRPRSWLAFYPSSLPFPPSLSETGGVVLPSRVLGGEVRGYADVEIALLPMAARERATAPRA